MRPGGRIIDMGRNPDFPFPRRRVYLKLKRIRNTNVIRGFR